MLLALAFAAVLASGSGVPPAAAPAPLSDAERVRTLGALPASDLDIRKALFQMLERDPERLVCSERIQTGTRQLRTSCATLRAWFDNRLPGEIRNNDAPWQLVEEIKERRKKALMRTRGER